MLIDVHAHISDDKLKDRIDEVLKNAEKENVKIVVNASSDFKSIKRATANALKYENVYATLGVHPNDAYFYDEVVENYILEQAKNEKIIAIGEIGLDYYNLDLQLAYTKEKDQSLNAITEEDLKNKQKEIFVRQIDLANKLNLPIVVHSRDATKDTIDILKANKNKLALGGLIHCFSGSAESAKEYFSLGFYLSIGGAITFKNSRNMPNVLKEIGAERIMLETDCPYLCPEPFRGQINEPKNIPLICNKIAEILGKTSEEIEEITTKNAKNLFKRLKC